MRQALVQPQQAHDFVELCGIANAVRAGDVERDINIRLRIQGRQQVEFLEDEPDLALAQPGALGVGELREVVAIDDDAARNRRESVRPAGRKAWICRCPKGRRR